MPKMKKPTQMNRWVALDPAYPPLAGDPLMADPLLTTTTLLPGGSGFSSASRSQVNARAIPRPRPRLAPTTSRRPHPRPQSGCSRWWWPARQVPGGPGDRDHRSTSLGERASDPTPQASASANDDSGPA